ncbi:MAG: hypothetical protein OER85_09710 [Gammaproteobacteria bacterium]|nr:hypothetical protein [Gammaproteobacteria bacterium]
MSYAFDSRLGAQLYQLLPEVYRTRDKTAGQAGVSSGDESLAKYLDAHGHLLDLIHATLEQQLSDVLPESSQDWLLPYFAQLLAANMVSPEPDGRHAEVTHAVSWRQRKGTLKCAEEIAEAVGQMEVEIQEGWKRVAMTPRIGMPLMPTSVWDDTLDIDMTVPSEAARHPALPAAMVDLRRSSRAVEAKITNPAARVSSFGGVKQTWRQANLHGVPCFPGSFDDVSRRTVDFRTPDARNGHHHHKRLLAYAPPPAGLFPFDTIYLKWTKRNDPLYEHLIEEKEENGTWLIRNKTDRIIEITDHVNLEPARPYRVEGLNFRTKLSVDDGGRLELHRIEATEVQVDTFSTDDPVLTANDCLFNELSVGSGTARLDSCTILVTAYLYDLDAINCIFENMTAEALISGVVQYSRIPVTPPISPDSMTVEDCTSDEPIFFNNQSVLTAKAVLAPNTPKSIYNGASDGGEMGYFHNGRKGRPVRIEDDQSLDIPAEGGYPLKDIIFAGAIEAGGSKLVLIRSAAQSLTVNTALSVDDNGDVMPSLEATNCLFDNLTVAVDKGLARLEYCTVMEAADCTHLQASDSIFAGSIVNVQKPHTNKKRPSFLNCIRYSRVPHVLEASVAEALRLKDGSNNITPGSNTLETPVFLKFDYCTKDNGSWESIRRSAEFGEPGYGVLDPVTSDGIRFGAEDGGEMGAGHHKYYSLKAEAVLDKMREFLPVGIEPVLIQDTRLLHVPPEQLLQEQQISEEATGNGGAS